MTDETEFNPMRLVKNDDIRTVHVEGVGDVKYRPLTSIDMMKLNSMMKDESEAELFGFMAAWMMLNKVTPDFTYEMWEKSDPLIAGKVLTALVTDSDFRVSVSPKQL